MLISGFMGFLGAGGGGLPPTLYYAQSGQNIYIYDVLPLSGGGYAVAAYSAQSDVDLVVMRLDDSGNILWAKYFGGAGFQSPYNPPCLAQDASGNIFASFYFDTYPNSEAGVAKFQLSDGALLGQIKIPMSAAGFGCGGPGQILLASSGEILMHGNNNVSGGAPNTDVAVLRISTSLALNSQAHFYFTSTSYPGVRDDSRVQDIVAYDDGTYTEISSKNDPFYQRASLMNMSSSDAISSQAYFDGCGGGRIGKGSSSSSIVFTGHHMNTSTGAALGPGAIMTVNRSTMAISNQKGITSTLGSPVYMGESSPIYVGGYYFARAYISGYQQIIMKFDSSMGLVAAKELPTSIMGWMYLMKALADNSIIMFGYDNSATKRGVICRTTTALDHPAFVDRTGTFTVSASSVITSGAGGMSPVSRSRSASTTSHTSGNVTLTKATS